MNRTALPTVWLPDRRIAACWLLAASGVLRLGSVVQGAGPEMFSLEPLDGVAGTPIHIKGTGLKLTKHVLFFTAGSFKLAKFKANSDTELDVIAPDYWTAETPAMVAVWTSGGITVGLPPDTIRVNETLRDSDDRLACYQVVKGGQVRSAIGNVFIEEGGTVEKSQRGIVGFVRKGGTLLSLENPAGLVFYERGAVLGKDMRVAEDKNSYACRTLLETPEIVASLGIAPFVFKAPPPADENPKSIPTIKSVIPGYGYSGDIITLSGSGFTGTTEVYFAGSPSTFGDATKAAGFRVESDKILKVQVPDQAHFDQYIVVINPLGATVTIPPVDRNGFHESQPGNFHFRLVRGGTATSEAVNFIEKGGIVEKAGLLAFVKSGGRLVENPRVVFYETGAQIANVPERQKKNYHEVLRLEPSRLPELFYGMTGNNLRDEGVFPRKAPSQRKSPRRP